MPLLRYAKAPRFWWQPTCWNFPAMFLRPIGALYGYQSSRNLQKKADFKASVPVICVGNFVVGGSGKTPFCRALADILVKEGMRPIFLTRGFGGQERGPIQVKRNSHNARQVGDEAVLLAKYRTTIVAKNRAEGAKLAQSLGDIIIMDDGMQNTDLHKDYVFALIDSEVGAGNSLCLPAGPLRAPISCQLPYIDRLVIVGTGNGAENVIRSGAQRGLPMTRAQLRPNRSWGVKGKAVIAYSGIGRPEKFYDALEKAGANICEKVSFGDHQPIGPREARFLLARAFMRDAQLVTTEKDMCRIAHHSNQDIRLVADRSKAMRVIMEIDDIGALLFDMQNRIYRSSFGRLAGPLRYPNRLAGNP